MGRLLELPHWFIIGPLYSYSLYVFIRYRVLVPFQHWPNPYVANKTWDEDKYFLIFWWVHTVWSCVHTYGIAPYLIRQMHNYRSSALADALPYQWFVASAWFYLAFTPLPLLSAGKGRAVTYCAYTYLDNSVHAFGIVCLCVYLVKRLVTVTHEFAVKSTDRMAVRECWTRLIGLSTFVWILGGRALPIMAIGENFLFNYPTVNAVAVICVTSVEPFFAYYYMYARLLRDLRAVRAGRPC